MKNISLYSFLMVLSLLTASNAFAYDLEVDGIYYNLDMDNYTASVTSGDNKYIGDVVIPPKFSYNYKVEFDVVEIEKQAFSSCSELTSVSIGEGVTAIGSSAFYNCKKLVSVSIPSTVKTIGSSAFYGCQELVKADLPEGIEKIEHSTFCNCYKLAEIKIPSIVKTIGDQAFLGCKSVTKLFIPKAVEYLGTDAFGGLTLEELVVEDGAKEIKVYYWPFHSTSTQTLYMGRPLPLDSNFKNDETKTLILGPNLNKWYNTYTGTGVTKVISNITDPSQLAPVFDAITYLDAKLIVPKGTLALYGADANWKKFLDIEEQKTTAVEAVNTSEDSNGRQMFNLGGMRVSDNSKGITIIRENGKVKKIIR